MRKAQLIVQMLHARDEWEPLINHVGLPRVGIGGVSGLWSVKNIVSHIMCREQHLADRLAEIARGEPEIVCRTQSDLEAFYEEFGYPDFGSPLLTEYDANELVFQKYRNVAMNEVVADELHAFECLMAAVRSLSEETLNERGLVRRIKHVTVEHYRDHGADIRKRFKRPLRQF
jgi:hypothetical protein